MTLWILFCRMSNRMDTLFAFYARVVTMLNGKLMSYLKSAAMSG